MTLDDIENRTRKLGNIGSGHTPLPNETILALVAAVRASDQMLHAGDCWQNYAHIKALCSACDARKDYRTARAALDAEGDITNHDP